MSTSPPPPADSLIKLRGLSRSFGSQQVLRGIDLDVPRGGVFGLIGANGAGKTTLIKHLLGLLKARRTVLFSSHLLDEVSRVADRLAMIHHGRVVLAGTLDEVRHSHRRVILRLSALKRRRTLARSWNRHR